MLTKYYTVKSSEGLHARPAKEIVKIFKNRKVEAMLIEGSKRADPKSMLAIMSMAIANNSTVCFEIEGEDALLVGNELDNFFNERLASI